MEKIINNNMPNQKKQSTKKKKVEKLSSCDRKGWQVSPKEFLKYGCLCDS